MRDLGGKFATFAHAEVHVKSVDVVVSHVW